MIEYTQYTFDRALSTVRSLYGSAPGETKWLDLGCHNGSFARQLSARGYYVTGIDTWRPELKKDTSWNYMQFDLERCQKEPLPLESSFFSIVSGLEIIEHVVDTDALLREIYRVLKPGGLLVLTTPNINMLRNRIRVLFGYYPWGAEYRNKDHHVRIYNLQCILTQLKEHNFKIRSAEGIKFLPMRFVVGDRTKRLSELLARTFPSLCSNLFIIAEKQ